MGNQKKGERTIILRSSQRNQREFVQRKQVTGGAFVCDVSRVVQGGSVTVEPAMTIFVRSSVLFDHLFESFLVVVRLFRGTNVVLSLLGPAQVDLEESTQWFSQDSVLVRRREGLLTRYRFFSMTPR